jgi:hypothetical protein
MSKKISLSIDLDLDLYKELKQRFKDDEQGLNQFIIDVIKNQSKLSNSSPEKKEDLESYVQKGYSGSRTYGVKGQGW